MSNLRRLIPSPHALFTFEAAARHLNFRAAAQELNVTQPSISHAIRKLEEMCGVPLFIRENRGVQLTDEGRKLQDAVKDSFLRMETTLRDIGTTASRYLTVAVSTTLAAHWLLPQLHALQLACPDLKLKVVTTDKDVEPDAEIDLTIRINPKTFHSKDSWYLCDEVVFPVCSPGYLMSAAPIATASDLRNHNLVHAVDRYRHRLSWSDWLVRADALPLAKEPSVVFHDFLLALQATLAGEGVALGWNLSFDLLLRNRLLIKPLATEIRTGQAYYLIVSPDPAPEVLQLVDWLLSVTAHLRNGSACTLEQPQL